MQEYLCSACGEKEYVSDRVSQMHHTHYTTVYPGTIFMLQFVCWTEDYGQATDAKRKEVWLLTSGGGIGGEGNAVSAFLQRARKENPVAQAFSAKMTRRANALAAMENVVRRLVETATFTLSSEDFTTLEHAVKDYEASRS